MPVIILDRDGVINFESDAYIKSPAEWHAIPGSLEAIVALNQAGYQVVVATNQAGIGRGFYDIAMLERIHAKLTQQLTLLGGKIEEFFFCPHHPDEKCACRKPEPGMLVQIQQKYALCLQQTYFVGDSMIDIQAAEKVGCKPILVLTGNGKLVLAKYPELSHIPVFADLASFVKFILS